MRQMLALCSDRGRVGFVVVSDQSQVPTDFNGLPYAFGSATQDSSAHYLEDLAALSMCDIVLATASSFAFWGAFQGQCPVIPLTRPGQQVRLEDAITHIWDCPKHPDLKIPMC